MKKRRKNNASEADEPDHSPRSEKAHGAASDGTGQELTPAELERQRLMAAAAAALKGRRRISAREKREDPYINYRT